MEPDSVEIGAGAFQDATGALFGGDIIHEDVDIFDAGEMADYFRVDPGDGLEFSRPVFGVVRPREPGSFMRLPFGGHAIAESARGGGIGENGGSLLDHSPSPSRKRLTMGPYASIRRSRRKGQLRRVSSIFCRSISAIRVSSRSCGALAMMRPKGSARNEPPQNSRPGPSTRLPRMSPCSRPTRFTPAT